MPERKPLALWMREPEIRVRRDAVRITFSTENGRVTESEVAAVFEAALGLEVLVTRSELHSFLVLVRTTEPAAVVRSAEPFVQALPLVHPDDSPFWPDVSVALGWQTVPGTEFRGDIGNLEYLAKWKGNQDASRKLGALLSDLAERHETLNRAQAVYAVPSSRGLAQLLARDVANRLRVPTIVGRKAPDAVKQQDSDEEFDDAQSRIRGRLQVPKVSQGRVLIVDDLYGKGITIAEVTRCLRAQGVHHVSSLTATKTARFHRQA